MTELKEQLTKAKVTDTIAAVNLRILERILNIRRSADNRITLKTSIGTLSIGCFRTVLLYELKTLSLNVSFIVRFGKITYLFKYRRKGYARQ